MTTLQTMNRGARREQLRMAVANRRQGDSAPSCSLVQTLGFEGRRLVGAVLLPLGILLMATLWLLPVGLPLALTAVALIAAPGPGKGYAAR
jgi:hypothetical protein